MIDPVLICEEFLPTEAVRDLEVEVSFGQITDAEKTERAAIWTTVSYKHLSDLSLRMYKAGYILNDIEGNLAHVRVNQKTGLKVSENPLIMVIFVKTDNDGGHRFDPSRN